MLAGKPIVASKVDAIPDIITSGENGILVEPDNSEEVKNEILKLYENKNFRKKLVMQGLTDVKKFDVKRVAAEHQRMFMDIVNVIDMQ